MTEDLNDLVAGAAANFVKQLATESWKTAVSAITALWRRVHPKHVGTVEADALDSRATALDARKAGDEQAEQDLILEWRSRLRRLVAADPSIADDLRKLAANREQPSVSMNVRASGHSRVTVAGRDVHITNP